MDRPRGGRAPRSCRRAGTASTAAAMATRTVTAAPGVQPLSIKLVASAPDVPKVAADRSAKASPRSLLARTATSEKAMNDECGNDLTALDCLHLTEPRERGQGAFCS